VQGQGQPHSRVKALPGQLSPNAVRTALQLGQAAAPEYRLRIETIAVVVDADFWTC